MPVIYGWELNEFDPFFNYRATQFIVDNGFDSYLSWHDDLSWHPTGRDVSKTSQAFLHMFTAFTYKIFEGSVSLYDFTIIFPVIVGSLTTVSIFFVVRLIGGNSSGLFAALLFSVSTPIIIRGSLGWFKSEPLGLFLGTISLYLFLSGIEGQSKSKFLRLIFGGIVLSCAISAWGGASFFIIPIGIFIFLIPFFKNDKFIILNLTCFTVSLLVSSLLFERPGLTFITNSLGLMIISSTIFSSSIILLKTFRNTLNNKKIIFISLIIFLIIAGTFSLLDNFIFESKFTHRYYNAINPFLTSSDPLVDSVSEHQTPDIKQSFAIHTILIIFGGLGIWIIFLKLTRTTFQNEKFLIFAIIFGMSGIFISSTFMRLELFGSISLIIFSSVGLSALIKSNRLFLSSKNILFSLFLFSGLISLLISPMILYDTNPAVSNTIPPTILNGGSMFFISSNDWLDTLEWIKNSTDSNSVIASWWDYGYWIQTKGERATLIDNSTLSTEAIKEIAKIMMSDSADAWKNLKNLDVDYILIFVSANRLPFENENEKLYTLGGGGDESKKFWFIKIANQDPTKFLHSDMFSGTDYFWNETLLGKLIPYSITGYVDLDTNLVYSTFVPGTVGIYKQDIKFSENDPFELVYNSPSFDSSENGPVLGIFVYKIN